jgi:thiamine biosynthesis protein ThiS
VQVLLHGEPREVAPGSTVTDLLTELGLGSGWVVVERNGEPVERTHHASTTLAEGDRLEIVRAVAGG